MVEVRIPVEKLLEEMKPIEKEVGQAGGDSNQAVDAANEGETLCRLATSGTVVMTISIEESHEAKTKAHSAAKEGESGKEVGQAGGGSNQPVSATNEDEASRQQWFQFILCAPADEEFKEDQSQTPDRRIHRVPQKFRSKDDFKKYYEPRVVSIGPYHSQNPDLQQMNFKTKMAGKFCRILCDKKADFKSYLEFQDNIKGLKNQLYDDELTRGISDDDFAKMMFLDGCFIMVFLYYFIISGLEELGMTKDIILKVQHDIFLLENQLPFEVLDKLCHSDRVLREYQLPWILDRYFRYCTIGYNLRFPKELVYDDIKAAQPLHLLDLLRITWLGEVKGKGKGKPKICEIVGQECDSLLESLSLLCIRDLFRNVGRYLFRKSHMSGFSKLMKTRQLFMKGRVVRNIKELIETGIYVRPNTSNLLSDIHFSSILTGKLAVPRLIIDSSTRTIFSNMIAHEDCMKKQSGFTSYISFLDSLIDNAEDVKLLRTAGVLENFLNSTDDEVANLFNELGADLVPKDDIYMPVKIDIYSYMESNRVMVGTWLAEVSRTHFRSPWTIIAVLAAFLAIALTAVQTYFAIFPRSS